MLNLYCFTSYRQTRHDGATSGRTIEFLDTTRSSVAPAAKQAEIRVECRDRLGGLIHEYVLAA